MWAGCIFFRLLYLFEFLLLFVLFLLIWGVVLLCVFFVCVFWVFLVVEVDGVPGLPFNALILDITSQSLRQSLTGHEYIYDSKN